MNCVVDAAVAIKWFVAEPLRPAALRLLDPDTALHAPDLILADLAETVRLRLQRGAMAPEQARLALRHAPACFERLHPAREIHEQALELGLRLGLPAAPCFYLACARTLDAALVTADARLAGLDGGPLAISILPLAALPALAS